MLRICHRSAGRAAPAEGRSSGYWGESPWLVRGKILGVLCRSKATRPDRPAFTTNRSAGLCAMVWRHGTSLCRLASRKGLLLRRPPWPLWAQYGLQALCTQQPAELRRPMGERGVAGRESKASLCVAAECVAPNSACLGAEQRAHAMKLVLRCRAACALPSKTGVLWTPVLMAGNASVQRLRRRVASKAANDNPAKASEAGSGVWLI